MGKAHQHSVCPMAQAIRGEFQSSCVHASGFRQILEQLCVHQALKGSNCPNRHYSSWLSNIPTTKGWTTLHVNRGTAPAQSRLTGLCGWYQDLREPRSRVQSTSIWAVWKPFAPREQQESWPSLTHFRSDNCVARSHKFLKRLVCKTRKVSMCWIRKVLLDCSTASVSVAKNCHDDVLPSAISTWTRFDNHYWGQRCPARTIFFPVTSSLATLAIMMKTRRRRPQRLRSGQKCRSSKIIHSGGKQSPEDLLTRPHCWKDSGLRLYINYII